MVLKLEPSNSAAKDELASLKKVSRSRLYEVTLDRVLTFALTGNGEEQEKERPVLSSQYRQENVDRETLREDRWGDETRCTASIACA